MISVVILAKNEQNNIADCIASVSWCDEILVIDDNSEDKTVEIAKKKGATVIVHSLEGDFSEQRNFGLRSATHEWVLFVDADERISSALWYEIMQNINDPTKPYKGFYFKRRDTIWGKELTHGETGNVKLLRLAQSNAGVWEGKVHEKWNVRGKTLILNNALLHFPHSSIEEFLREINIYTDLRAAELYKMKVKVKWFDIIFYPLGKFIADYFVLAGCLDGIPGLFTAMLMSLHSFLVRGKLWLLLQDNSS